jgi:hypothetical protein
VGVAATPSSVDPARTEPSADSPASGPYQQYIETQLKKTGWHVQLTDLASHLMALAIGVLGLLFVVVLIDHWLMGLGFWARLLAFVLLLSFSLLIIVRQLVLPIARHVNPFFSARLIEQSEPSLKNSLINFLCLRREPRAVHQAVYQAMEQRAAADLGRVDVDSAVDRSQLIHIGYVLVAVIAGWGLYTIFSPKDPLQTVARVCAPWKRIARPARLEITDVQPGDAQVYYGRAIEVSAVVRSRSGHADVPVSLVYSAQDGRIVDQQIGMKRKDGEIRYRCQVPDDLAGIVQDLVYHIEAGDAATDPFTISVLPAPSMVVESIRYDYPAYTNRSPQTIPRQGDISALEGTQVTIRARANEPIKSAYVEFDVPSSPEPLMRTVRADPGGAKRPPQTIPMSVSGHEAEVSFTLLLQADRQTPWHSNYRLRFSTPDDETDPQPVLYRIDVIPDLPPLVEILKPDLLEIEVPADGRATIQVRAVDPDFALQSVRLRAVSDDIELFDVPLVDEPEQGQVTKDYDFVPHKLNLSEGEMVIYWAVAEDNRMSSHGTEPGPNTSQTTNYKIRIVAPRNRGQTDRTSSPGEKQGSSDDRDASRTDQDARNEASEPTDSGDRNRSDQAEGESPEGGEQATSAESGQGEKPTEADQGGGPNDGSSPRDDPQNGQRQAQAGDAQGDSADSDHPEQATDGRAGQPRPSAAQQGDQRKPEGERFDPLPNNGERDGEAFDRILERAREQQAKDSRGQDQTESAEQGKPPRDHGAADGRGGDPRQNNQERPADRKQPDSAGGQQSPDQQRPRGDDRQDSTKGEEPWGEDRHRSRDGAFSSKDKPSTDSPAPEDGPGRAPDRQPDQGETSPSEGQPRDAVGRAQRVAKEGTGNSDPTNQRPESSSGQSKTNQSQGPRQPSEKESARQDRTRSDVEGGQPGAERESVPDARQQTPTGAESAVPSGQSPTQGPNADKGQSAVENGAQTSDRHPKKTPAGPSGSEVPGGGDQGGSPNERAPADRDGEPGGDDPNVRYTQKATDLAIQYLKDQQDKPDQELLDRLGWTKADIQRFIERWERMKGEAARPGEQGSAARRKLDEALRSLGLSAGPSRLRRGQAGSDHVRGMRQSGQRTSPPAEYREQYEAYLRSRLPSHEDSNH